MKNRKYSKGFTLVELLIVIAIIGVLAGLIYPALSGAMGESNKMKSMNNAPSGNCLPVRKHALTGKRSSWWLVAY